VRKVDVGKHGEAIAVEYLSKRGLIEIERNFYTRFGEIDIIALNGDVYHFIEVKTRLGDTYGSSLESMTQSKMNNFVRTIQAYIKKNSLSDINMSVDFIGIDISLDGTIDIEWIENITL